MAKNKTLICVYCQEEEATTRDHVPPKLIFPEPRPSNLITVPACKRCNNDASKDDEYFRTYLTARTDPDEFPTIEPVTAAAFRAFDRKKGLYKGWLRHTRTVKREDVDGLVEEVRQFQPEDDRLKKVIERTVRGLHFHHSSQLIPTSYHFSIMGDYGFDDLNEENPVSDQIHRFQDEEGRNCIAGSVFEYYLTYVEGATETTVWLLRFFIRSWFLVIVCPEDIGKKILSRQK